MNVRIVLPLAICIALILFFFSIIISNSVNIPNGDDLYCLLLFTQKFQDTPSLVGRLGLLFEQWVEHRIVYSRFTALLSYWLTSHVNFVTIIIIGNMTLIGFTFLFWKVIKKTGVSLFYLIPVVLTLFSPVTYEANLWAGASTVYMPVAFLGLLTIYLIVYQSNNSWDLIFPILTALLATYSFGNGMFALVAGLAVLLYQKRYRAGLAWAIIGIFAVFFYFQDFEAHSSTNAFSIADHFKKPIYLLYNLFGFIGGIVDYTENVNSEVVTANIPALLLGVFLLLAICGGVVLFLFKTTFNQTAQKTDLKLVWLGMAVFVMMTAVVMAYSRTSGSAMNTMSSRYKIYSMIFWVLVYCGCLIHFEKKKIIGVVFGITSLMMLLFNYYTHYDKLTNFKSYLLSGLFNYNTNGQWIIYRHTSYYEGASKLLSDSIAQHHEPVYVFAPVFPQLTHDAIKNAPTLRDITLSTDRNCHGQKGQCLTLHTNEYPSISNYFKGIYLVVYNDANIYLFVANPVKNGRINMLIRGDYYKAGFSLDKNFGSVLKAGNEYKLAVFCPTEKEQIKLIQYKLEG